MTEINTHVSQRRLQVIERSIMIVGTMAVLFLFSWISVANADSSSEQLAAYYDRKMVLCTTTAYQWESDDKPSVVAENVAQVGVGRDASYILTKDGTLLSWEDNPGEKREILSQVKRFVAGRSGVLAIRQNDSLWYLARPESWFGEGDVTPPVKISENALSGSIGDSANYYVTNTGRLHAKGLAHRGQYGDGKLQSTDHFVQVADNVRSVKAHTGHAIYLAETGDVFGTGGNIYGPIGSHGIGDKAIKWAPIFHKARAIATGSSHSLAIRADNTLWSWGRDIGLTPKQVLNSVRAVAADQSGSIALREDNTLWQWDRGKKPQQHFACP
ncbi:RCC1 domain-containing protein [Kiloniella sp.]|uniref:RCC1 domain-containing protein n=1 Tax=Kiloniella sp. TaxID=1938587 RepID=UPI003B013207